MFRFSIRDILWLLILLLSMLLTLNCATAIAVDLVELPIPHDNRTVRKEVGLAGEATESTMLLALIEPLAVADRTQRLERPFPYSYKGLKREQVERRLGKPIDWKEDDFARPAAGGGLLTPNGSPAGGLNARAAFYAHKDIGGICVFYSENDFALVPCAIYLRTDSEFVPLRRTEDTAKRLDWERPKLEQLRLWLGIPETIVKNPNGEWQVRRDSKE